MNKKITELQNTNSLRLDTLPTNQIIKLINNEDSKISLLIKDNIPKISELINKTVKNIKKGGRLIYVGAGTSGRLGVLDASECPPTFSVSSKLVVGIIAGGTKALQQSIEGAEDDFELAIHDFKKNKINKKDTIIGITTSGTTPYVNKFLKEAKKIGSFTAIITSNKLKKEKWIDIRIECLVGPEIITGSTRMKAGTATKMILNMISTTVMIKLNKVYKNLMVDLKISNDKLLKRAIRIITSLTDLNKEKSKRLLKNAKGEVKTALLMHLNKKNYKQAKTLLSKTKGNLRQALKEKNE